MSQPNTRSFNVDAFVKAFGGAPAPAPAPARPERAVTIPADLSRLILSKVADPKTTYDELVNLATMASRVGAHSTAANLRARAEQKARQASPVLPPMPPPSPVAGEVGRQMDETFAVAPPAPPAAAAAPEAPSRRPTPPLGTEIPSEREPVPSPLPGIPLERWMAFEKKMEIAAPENISPAGRYGMFAMSPKRLQDLGLVVSARKLVPNEARQLLDAANAEEDKGKADDMRRRAHALAQKGARWAATWRDDVPEERFLGSPDLQRRAFRKSMREYAKAVVSMYRSAFGKPVNGKVVTLSGLLAVAHIAGAPGLDSWLKDKSIREKFPTTTKAFEAATGIF